MSIEVVLLAACLGALVVLAFGLRAMLRDQRRILALLTKKDSHGRADPW